MLPEDRRLRLLSISGEAFVAIINVVLTKPSYMSFLNDSKGLPADSEFVSMTHCPETRNFLILVRSKTFSPVPKDRKIPLWAPEKKLGMKVYRIFWPEEGEPCIDSDGELSIEQICRDVLSKASEDSITQTIDGWPHLPEDMQNLTSGDLKGVAILLLERIRQLRKRAIAAETVPEQN